jgi:hypothetical protein
MRKIDGELIGLPDYLIMVHRALDLAVMPSLLVAADEVIE